MDWKFLFPSWTVSRRKREEMTQRAELTGKARESRTFLWGIIEVGVEAEILDEPADPLTKRNTR
jgi:hypothetical protein